MHLLWFANPEYRFFPCGGPGITVVLHLKRNTVFRFMNFKYKLLHTESLHAHRNSKTLTRFKFWLENDINFTAYK